MFCVMRGVSKADKSMTTSPDFLPARRVWERYGVTSMTLHRWIADYRMSFPKPHYFGRLRFWKISDLEAWERAQPRGKAAA